MNTSAPVNLFRVLWDMGYHDLIPVVPPKAEISDASVLKKFVGQKNDPRGKSPGVRGADGKWTSLRGWLHYKASEPDLDRWRSMGASIGMLAGGVCGIDADCYHAEDAAVVEAAVEETIGILPKRVGRAPKALYAFRIDGSDPLPYRRICYGDVVDGKQQNRVEIMAPGRQFVVYGVHPGTGQPYHWDRKLPPLDELPVVRAEQIGALFEKLKTVLPNVGEDLQSGSLKAPTQESLKTEYPIAKRLVEALPNTSAAFGTREDYLNVVYAIKASAGEDGLGLLQTWASRWDAGTNDPEVVAADFRRAKPPFRVGAPWLATQAEKLSNGEVTRAILWWEDPAEQESSIFPPEAPDPEKPRITPTLYRFPDPALIPKRASLYAGHYVRKFLSATIAQSKVGKSSLALAEMLAMASGKPLLGVEPAAKCRVWWWNGEDPLEELERRVAAAMKFYGLEKGDIEDRLLINSGRDMPICLASPGKMGAVLDKQAIGQIEDALIRMKIDAWVIDPWVSIHRVPEKDNTDIDLIAKTLARTADRANCAIDAVHHTRKLNGAEATIDDSRGASALLGATRSMRALTRMNESEGSKLGVKDEHRSFFRFSDVASNMAPVSGELTRWFRLASVNLENGAVGDDGDATDRAVGGDRVGVVTVWDFEEGRDKALAEIVTPDNEEKALAAIGANEWRRDTRAANWAGVPIAQAFGFDLAEEDGRESAKRILKLWKDQGKIVETNRPDRYRNTRTYVELAPRTSAADLFA